MAKSLAQLKVDMKNGGWPWPIMHPNDERALLAGCYTDFEDAEKVRRFFKKLLVVPSPAGGVQPFHLLDWWYRDVIAPIFGWKKPDGSRRFQKAFITTAKKSGKSTVLSGLAAYMLLADGEEEAEVYSAAVDRDQAAIVFSKTLRSVRLSPSLSKVCRVVESQKKIFHDKSGSKYEAISSDADSSEGKNPHALIADEIHVWRDRQFFNSLMYGDIARRQPLFVMITTAGDDDQSIGFEEYQAAKSLLDPDDPFYVQSTFAFIAEATDVEAGWDNPQSWLEAQPSLRGDVDTLRPRAADDPPAESRTIGSVEKLIDKCNEAKQSPRKKREFVRYICNRWVMESEDPWLSIDAWDECGGPVSDHVGAECWIGLDLAMTKDLAAKCLAFPRGDVIDLEWAFWTPAENIRKKEDQWRVPLRDWIAEGWIYTTPGETIDYKYIRQSISGATMEPLQSVSGWDTQRYNVREVAFDPWNATELTEWLDKYDGLVMSKQSPGIASISPLAKAFEKVVLERRIRHGNNPVARWMARNVVVDTDANGNIRPNKAKSRSKIDGIWAAIVAVGRAVTAMPAHSGSLFVC